jgi:hypothetical protein
MRKFGYLAIVPAAVALIQHSPDGSRPDSDQIPVAVARVSRLPSGMSALPGSG